MSPDVLHTIASECLVMRVRRLNREITRLYDAHARRHGLTAGAVNVLVAIGVGGGPRARDLVGPLSMEKSTLSRNVARLHEDGLVRVDADHRLFLSESGKARIEAIYPDWLLVQERARALLGDLVGPLLQRGS